VIIYGRYISSIFIVLGFLVAKAEATPHSDLYSAITMELGLPYFALEMTLNILCTLLIIVPIIRERQNVTAALGREHGRLYTHITAIIVESAMPNALLSFVFIILYATKNTAGYLIITPLLQIQASYRSDIHSTQS
jgi:hypothetical protein